MSSRTRDGAPRRFREHRWLQLWLAVYCTVWVLLAIDPIARREWLLENLLVVVLAILLITTYRRFPLSDTSYFLIFVFMVLHAVGAYYVYENVPWGFWLQELFGVSRNPFDRLVHGAFGLLLAQPIYEVFRATTGAGAFWSRTVPVSLVLALSALYEIIEAVVAEIVSPELGAAYLGSQGDRWDAQQDMLCGLVGGLLWVAAALALRAVARRSMPSSRTEEAA